jgi:hypothetical protein
VVFRKQPIEKHPWNIAVFHEGNQVTAQRIHDAFPEEAQEIQYGLLLAAGTTMYTVSKLEDKTPMEYCCFP